MRRIDVQTWSRRDHFNLYSKMDYPHFSMCANVDITTFYRVVKECGLSFTVALVYVISRASNAIPEFRYRIRPGEVIEHKIVHPSITVLVDEDLFSFCTFDYCEDYSDFELQVTEKIAYIKEHPTLKDESGRDDYLYMTAIPWVSFTSFSHPLHLHPIDSIPRYAWGRFFEEGDIVKMPLNVQAHHALMDGLHMGKFYTKLQEYLNQPDFLLLEA